MFFGTPHRGSDKVNYEKVLANVTTEIIHKLESKLLKALKSNSETLEKLTSEFKFEAPNMQILTFYETKPIHIFSSLVSTRGLTSLVVMTKFTTRLLRKIPLFSI